LDYTITTDLDLPEAGVTS